MKLMFWLDLVKGPVTVSNFTKFKKDLLAIFYETQFFSEMLPRSI